MLIGLFAAVKAYMESLSRTVAYSVIIICYLLGVGLVLWGGNTSGQTYVAVTLGSFAGIAWLLALYSTWWIVIPQSFRDSRNYRAQFSLTVRRNIMFWGGGLWLLLLAFTGGSTVGVTWVLLGATNVVVLVSLAYFGFASDEERKIWSEKQERAAREKLYNKAVEEGLITEEGEYVWEEEEYVEENPKPRFGLIRRFLK